MVSGIIIKPEWEESLKELTAAEVGELVMAAFDYRRSGTVPKFKDRGVRVIFLRWKAELDEDQRKWEETCERNRINGKKGGRPKKPVVLDETKRFTENPIEGNRIERNGIEKNREGESIYTDAPALEDIQLYFSKMGFTSDPEAFEAYYSARDWMVNGQKVTQWEKLAKSWEIREKKYESEKGGDPGDIGLGW